MPRPIRLLPALALAGAIAWPAGPAGAQGLGNPFAGGQGAGFGPYGNAAGASTHLIQIAPMAQAGATAATIAPRRPLTVAETREAPHRVELPEGARILEAMFIGCSAGAFLGGYTAWSTVLPAAELAVAAAPAAAPVAAGMLSASAIGCGLGAATATVTLAAGTLWRWVFR